MAAHVPRSVRHCNRAVSCISATTSGRCATGWPTRTCYDCFYCIVDLHALTLEIDPAELRARTHETALDLLAAGLDPDRCTLFVQSHVPEHTRLTWLLECTATMGELRRMTQFKDKSEGRDSVRVGLFTYPVLQAADILLYDADRVPVGDDQRQHLELARQLAQRFNHRYGDTFVVPVASVPPIGARVMDLQHPDRKMSKSTGPPLGTVLALRRARRDRPQGAPGGDRHRDIGALRPRARPGVSNLLELLAAATGRTPQDLAGSYSTYGQLKADVADALVELLRPIREQRAALAADPGAVPDLLAVGAAKAGRVADRHLRPGGGGHRAAGPGLTPSPGGPGRVAGGVRPPRPRRRRPTQTTRIGGRQRRDHQRHHRRGGPVGEGDDPVPGGQGHLLDHAVLR